VDHACEADAESDTPIWKQLLERAIVESNLPKFVDGAAEACRAIDSRLDELRIHNSMKTVEERAKLERTIHTLHDLLKIVPKLPNHLSNLRQMTDVGPNHLDTL
jgi:hypothetical protein